MFAGIYTALVTPLRNGHVDLDALDRLVDRQLDAGIQGLVVCATTGEGSTLGPEERTAVIRRVRGRTAGRMPLIVGTGSVSTWAVTEATRVAADLGADAALVVSPAYVKPSQAGIIAHYEQIADASPIPIIVYNVPGRTASDVLPATLARLSQHERIVAVKEASGSIIRGIQVIEAVAGRLDVLAGDDPLTVALLVHGGQGVISTAANVAPGHWATLWQRWLAGDIIGAAALQNELIGLHEALFTEANPGSAKGALHLLGLLAPEIRLPLSWPVADTLARLKAELDQLGITR